LEFLNEVERRFPVDTWTSAGIPIWPLIRVQLAFQWDEFLALSRQPADERGFQSWFRRARRLADLPVEWIRFAEAFAADRRHNDFPNHRTDVVFYSHATARVFSAGGAQFDIFADALEPAFHDLGLTSFIMESAPGGEYRIPRFGKSMYLLPREHFARLKSRFLTGRGEADTMDGFEEFAARVRAAAPDFPAPDWREIRQQAYFIRCMADGFKNILASVRPKLGFCVNYYSAQGMAFNLACRESGVRSVDMQHGVQTLHPAYARWQKVPPNGYALLPDVFWCWSGEEEKAIMDWSGPAGNVHRPVVGGNVILEEFLNGDGAFTRSFDEDFFRARGERPASLNVLVTLQTGRGLPETVRRVIQSGPDGWFWWIRLHPAMMAERPAVAAALVSSGRRNWDLDNASRLPLYTLLRHADVHLTETSSVVLEARRFSIPSGILSELGAELYENVVREGGAFMALEADEVLRALSSLASKPRSPRPASGSGMDPRRVIRQILDFLPGFPGR
jgi:hypothetical protein